MKYSFLFDNNIYRKIVKTGNEVLFEKFNSDIKNHRIIKNIPSKSINYSLTTFTIMEALGITIVYPNIILPKSFKSPKKYKEAFSFVNNEAKKYFKNLKSIKYEELIKKLNDQQKYTSIKAKKIEQIFIINPLKTQLFYNYFIEALVFDYVCKYEFPREIQKILFSDYLLPTFF